MNTPSTENLKNDRDTVTSDLLASIVVFLVAVPLALGIAISSGAPTVMAGLIGCAVGGIVVGYFGGAPLQVTGPAAGLTVLTYDLIQRFGWEVTCAITVGAGLVQILVGYLRLGRICLGISPAVVHGMLAGIGVIIALSQIHVVFGGAPQSSALLNLKELPAQLFSHHAPSTFIGLLSIGTMLIWPHAPAPLRKIPGALAAVGIGTFAALISGANVQRVELPEEIFSAFSLPALPGANFGGFIIAVLSVAMVASVESLLCAVATDKLHSGKRANLNKELVGQGLGNITSGLIGGLPLTGVIVRSSANISAGAKTNRSSMLHGLWVLLFVLLFVSIIEQIPLAALAGLLVVVGVKLVNTHHLRELVNHSELATYLVTVSGVVFIDLLSGVAMGIGVAFISLLRRLARLSTKVTNRDNHWHVQIEGSASFVTVPKLLDTLSAIPQGARVDIDLLVDFMDHAAFDALHGWRVTHERLGGKVDIDELHEEWYQSAADGRPLVAGDGDNRTFRLPVAPPTHSPARRIEDLVEGIKRFNRLAPSRADESFSKLAAGQKPEALFITCADSRIVPNLLTFSSPGDLFTLRNIGNLIPPPSRVYTTNSGHSVGAAIEYALMVLKVPNIIICGHSNCGAMKAILEEQKLPEGSALETWLANGKSSLDQYRQGCFCDCKASEVDKLARANVVTQIDHLKEYPVVKEALQAGRLQLWGWFFDIEAAQILVYDGATGEFVDPREREIASGIPVPAFTNGIFADDVESNQAVV